MSSDKRHFLRSQNPKRNFSVPETWESYKWRHVADDDAFIAVCFLQPVSKLGQPHCILSLTALQMLDIQSIRTVATPDMLGEVTLECYECQLSSTRRQNFIAHYKMYTIDRPRFEFKSTRKYCKDALDPPHVMIVARERLDSKIEIEELCGVCVHVPAKEVQELEDAGCDFSLIRGYRGAAKAFFGPARYLNSDCEPNCKLVKRGQIITVKVDEYKTIEEGQELTINYEEFFIDGECLCTTCKRASEI